MKKASKVILILALVAVVLLPTAWVLSSFLLEEVHPVVKVISIKGAISGDMSGEVVRQIASADSDSAAIILEINSPGGTVVASEEIAQAVASAKVPVVAWIREVGASGAYWIASSADAIVADQASITGSIGVTGSYLQFSDFFKEWGIGYERLVTGKYKDTGSPYKDMTPDEREYMMDKLYKIKSMFVEHVSSSRNISREQVEKLATGEIFLGTEAYENGLVDYLGGKDKAFEVAKELAGVSDATLSEPRSGTSLFELFTSKASYWFGKGFADSILKLAEQRNGFTA